MSVDPDSPGWAVGVLILALIGVLVMMIVMTR